MDGLLPKVIQVIESEISRGSGLQKNEIKFRGGAAQHKLKEDDEYRYVKQYHTLDGEFLAEVDPRTEKIMRDFRKEEEKKI